MDYVVKEINGLEVIINFLIKKFARAVKVELNFTNIFFS
jgi:hypothetical protein